MRVIDNKVLISLLFIFSFLSIAYAEEPAAPALPQPMSTTSDSVEDLSPASEAASENRSEVAQLGELEAEDAKAEEQEAAAMAGSAPSDGSENGGRLPGLDSMGDIQSAAEYAGAAGELKYQVGINMPSFRDLEPKLGFVYNSQVTGKSGAESILGTG